MSEQADGVVTINAGILSGTGSKLALLGDVNIVSPTNNQVLTYQSSTAMWVNSGVTGGGNTLAGLSDVTLTSLQDDQFLRYNTGTSKWINQFITAADIGSGTFKAGAFVFPSLLVVSGTDVGNLQTIFGTSSQRFYGNMQIAADNSITGGTGPGVNLLVYSAYSGTGTNRGEPALVTYRSRGSLTAPQPPKDLDRLFSYGAGGWNGSSWSIGSTLAVEAFGDWGGGLGGTRFKFLVNASGTGTGAYVLAIENNVMYPILDLGLDFGKINQRWNNSFIGGNSNVWGNETVGGNFIVSGTTTLRGATNIVGFTQINSLFVNSGSLSISNSPPIPQLRLEVAGSASSASGFAMGESINPTLTASADNASLFSLRINSNYSSGTFNNILAYGIKIENVTGGTPGQNFAIQTSLGKINFGDQTIIGNNNTLDTQLFKVYGDAKISKTLTTDTDVSTTALIASGITTLVGRSTQQVGTSNVFAPWPSVLFQLSGTQTTTSQTEGSLASYNLKANSLNAAQQVVKISAIYNAANNSPGAYNIKLGSGLIASGTLTVNQESLVEVLLWRLTSTTERAFTRTISYILSGTSTISHKSITVTQVYALSSDLTIDNTIDFRGNLTSGSTAMTLYIANITYEAD